MAAGVGDWDCVRRARGRFALRCLRSPPMSRPPSPFPSLHLRPGSVQSLHCQMLTAHHRPHKHHHDPRARRHGPADHSPRHFLTKADPPAGLACYHDPVPCLNRCACRPPRRLLGLATGQQWYVRHRDVQHPPAPCPVRLCRELADHLQSRRRRSRHCCLGGPVAADGIPDGHHAPHGRKRRYEAPRRASIWLNVGECRRTGGLCDWRAQPS